MSINNIEAKAFLFPPSKGVRPVVVSVKQGQSPVKGSPELVPVGPGKLAIEGPPDISIVPLQGSSGLQPDSLNEPFRVRAYILIDISSSMNEPAGNNLSRLKLAQNKIATFSSGLKQAGINNQEFILIPFDDNAEIKTKTQDCDKLIRKVLALHPRGSTNFTAALNLVLKDINSNPLNQARNLIIMITDGEHNLGKDDPALKAATELLPKADCGIYLVGVGNKYNEELLKDMLRTAKFGGLTHIPHPKQDIFKTILPPFIGDMRSAPYYPIVSFNNFKSTYNMTPSIREVIEELGEKHFATVGYQREGYAIGFVNEEDLDKGRALVHLIVKEDANGNPIHTEEIIPVPFEDAILDPNERKLIGSFPLLIGLESILGKRDANLLEQFINDNKKKLPPDLKDILFKELANLKNPFRTEDNEGETREAYSSITTRAAEASFLARTGLSANDLSLFTNPENPRMDQSFEGDLSVIGHSGGVGPLDPNERTINISDMNVNKIDPLAYENINPQKKLTLEIKSGGQLELEFKDKEEKTFGRGLIPMVSVTIPDCPRVVSRRHFAISRFGNEFFIKDLDSSNGTYVNGERITGEKKLSPGDKIKVASVTFTANF